MEMHYLFRKAHFLGIPYWHFTRHCLSTYATKFCAHYHLLSPVGTHLPICFLLGCILFLDTPQRFLL